MVISNTGLKVKTIEALFYSHPHSAAAAVRNFESSTHNSTK